MAVFQPEQSATSLSDLPSTTSIPRIKNGKIQLPANFVPTESTVICGRGNAGTTSIGNRRLKSIVNSFLKPYSEAKNKLEKSAIVSRIVGAIKRGGGNFVKCEDGIWWEVYDAYAREKVGCLLRDYLHAQYPSSTKAKIARRKALKTMDQESTFYYDTYLHQVSYTSKESSQSSMLTPDASSSTAEDMYRPSASPSLSYQRMMQGTISEESTFYYDTYLHQGSCTSNDSQSSMLTLDASSSTFEEIYCPSPSLSYQRMMQGTISEESTFYYDTHLHQGSYTSKDSQNSMLTDASSATFEEIYCPSPSLSYQPMMQGTIRQDAYMMPVKSTTNCVQGGSYDQQQPSQGTGEYCSLFSNYQRRNRQCRTDFLHGCMPTSTCSMGVIGSARPTQATAGKQTMSALEQACGLFGEVTEINTEDDLLDDTSGIFEEW
jgi:hypothetical protein